MNMTARQICEKYGGRDVRIKERCGYYSNLWTYAIAGYYEDTPNILILGVRTRRTRQSMIAPPRGAVIVAMLDMYKYVYFSVSVSNVDFGHIKIGTDAPLETQFDHWVKDCLFISRGDE